MSYQVQELMTQLRHLARELAAEFHSKYGCSKPHSDLATKSDLEQLGNLIMSVLSDFSAKQTAHNDKVSAGLDSISTDIDGVVTQITGLKALITTLQNSPGPISTDDQKTLDAAEASSAALETKAGAVQAKADALSNVTPPVVPTTA